MNGQSSHGIVSPREAWLALCNTWTAMSTAAQKKQARVRPGGAIHYLAYPLMIVANLAFGVYVIATGGDLEGSLPIGIFASLFYLLVLERWIPYRADWRPSWWEWIRDLLFLFHAGITGAAGTMIATWFTLHFASPYLGRWALPLGLEFFLYLQFATFIEYWSHRFYHVHPLLWRFHGVHHVPAKVNLTNGWLNHFLETVPTAILQQVLIVAIGVSEETVFLYTLVLVANAFGVHCNADVRLGWLNYILIGPEQHRLHHSLKLAEAGHHGAITPLWDMVFNTFSWRPDLEVTVVGVTQPAAFPKVESVFALIPCTLLPVLPILPNPKTVSPRVMVPGRAPDNIPWRWLRPSPTARAGAVSQRELADEIRPLT